MQQTIIIMLGAPGAGKGTQAVRISEKMHLPQISTGDLFRENLKNNTSIGQKAKSYMDKGELVPDDVVIDMLFERISRPDAQNGYILDGFPRTVPQAESFDKRLNGQGKVVALNLDVPDEMIVQRLAGRLTCSNCGAPYHISACLPKVSGICDRCQGTLIQRSDDKEEVIRKRLAVYHEQTEPLIAYYKKNGKLTTIDGTFGKEKTVELVDKALDEALR